MDTRSERERRLPHQPPRGWHRESPVRRSAAMPRARWLRSWPKWPEARSTRVFWASTWTICSVWVRARNSNCASTSRSSTTIGDRKIALLVSIASAQAGSLSADQRAPADQGHRPRAGVCCKIATAPRSSAIGAPGGNEAMSAMLPHTHAKHPSGRSVPHARRHKSANASAETRTP